MDNKVVKFQSLYRGYIYRIKRMPLILYVVQNYLISQKIKICKDNDDGRTNSTIDEKTIIKCLCDKFTTRIKVADIRMWYDIKLYDSYFGWLPVNIKTSYMNSRDNTGNLAMCVYAYTNYDMSLDKIYNNGSMSNILHIKLKNKEYNNKPKRDYYFIVINKTNTNNIIINSVKGLEQMSSNGNNLPFQICWNNNATYNTKTIDKCIEIFVNTLKKTKQTWRDKFIHDMHQL